MTDSNSRLVSAYGIEQVALDSEGFKRHQALVTRIYSGMDFIDSDEPELLRDKHDTHRAAYYLLNRVDEPEVIDGTFRIIDNTGGGFPVFDLYPHLSIEGISNRLCESTRVVSVKRNLSGRSQPTRNILFEAVVRAMIYVRANDLYAVISLGSPAIFEWINNLFCGAQRGLGVPVDYHGGIVVPSIIWLEEFESLTRAGRPDIHDYYQENLETYQKQIQ